MAALLFAMLMVADARSQMGPATGAKPAAAGTYANADQAAWQELLEIAGANLPPDIDLEKTFGPLPGQQELHDAGCMTPPEFLFHYRSAGDRSRRIMQLFAAARMRELSRRGLLSGQAKALLAPEPPGVSGSEFFGIPPIPGDAYSALLNYLQSAAEMIPGAGYKSSQASREMIDRHLQASLALSSTQARAQYADFDVVWSEVLIETVCAGRGSEKSMAPGLLWLYNELRVPAGLDFLPAVPESMQSEVEKEAGELFQRARIRARDLKPGLAALTDLPCRPATNP